MSAEGGDATTSGSNSKKRRQNAQGGVPKRAKYEKVDKAFLDSVVEAVNAGAGDLDNLSWGEVDFETLASLGDRLEGCISVGDLVGVVKKANVEMQRRYVEMREREREREDERREREREREDERREREREREDERRRRLQQIDFLLVAPSQATPTALQIPVGNAFSGEWTANIFLDIVRKGAGIDDRFMYLAKNLEVVFNLAHRGLMMVKSVQGYQSCLIGEEDLSYTLSVWLTSIQFMQSQWTHQRPARTGPISKRSRTDVTDLHMIQCAIASGQAGGLNMDFQKLYGFLHEVEGEALKMFGGARTQCQKTGQDTQRRTPVSASSSVNSGGSSSTSFAPSAISEKDLATERDTLAWVGLEVEPNVRTDAGRVAANFRSLGSFRVLFELGFGTANHKRPEMNAYVREEVCSLRSECNPRWSRPIVGVLLCPPDRVISATPPKEPPQVQMEVHVFIPCLDHCLHDVTVYCGVFSSEVFARLLFALEHRSGDWPPSLACPTGRKASKVIKLADDDSEWLYKYFKKDKARRIEPCLVFMGSTSLFCGEELELVESPYRVMRYRYLPGENIWTRGQVKASKFLDVVDALVDAHGKGWVHCDIRGANLLDTDGKLLLIDWEYALQVGQPMLANLSQVADAGYRMEEREKATAEVDFKALAGVMGLFKPSSEATDSDCRKWRDLVAEVSKWPVDVDASALRGELNEWNLVVFAQGDESVRSTGSPPN
eukprot:TRINITY_DN246_c0_g1_i4.p1 TRINITY_DN246_c0_g1~~TRINITY_DN246_c0_g1_i4.p1  ORF type:complete len:790 (-),score=122.76 TRINITY_DN246_c0_g1_i4:58-2220(-)